MNKTLVIAAVLAYFFLDEMLGIAGIIGASLIVAGILVSEFFDNITAKLFFRNQPAED